ncbi:OmpA family protein [Leptobacterium sp. I13]|uniref:OmpA family protein n=1 Tax=Leptobacterium meishanense TaxID=3128904 RepID=UPI0030EBA58A
MKKILFILFIISSHTYGQLTSSISVKRADKLFNEYAYAAAAEMYEKLAENDPQNNYLKVQLATSYRKMNNPEKTAYWYAKAVEAGEVSAVDKLYYAQALMANQEYEKAEIWIEKYQQAINTDRRADALITGIKNIKQFYTDSDVYLIKPVEFNSQAADFSPSYYREGLVFVSARQVGNIGGKIYKWDKSPFLEIFFVDMEDSTGIKARLFDYELNTRYHEGPLSFYENDNKVIFTRNDYNGEVGMSSKNEVTLELYLSNWQEEKKKWAKPTEFPYNNKEYSLGHPSITPDGKTLYFASDMPGGYGGVDLYISEYKSGGWTTPVNLGSEINTEGDEEFPYIKGEVLYFSSNGHEGLGGLDIYSTPITSGKIKVQNIGYPINSSKDDFGIIFNRENTGGYFSSNRDGGMGNDDIYSFFITNPNALTEGCFFKGFILDTETQEGLSNTKITIKNKDTNEFQEIYTNEEGYFETEIVLTTKGHEIELTRQGYFPRRELLIKHEPSCGTTEIHYELRKIKVNDVYRIENIYFDLDKSNIRPDAAFELDRLVEFLTENPSVKIELSSHTDSRGSDTYNLALSDRRAKSSVEYLISKGIAKNRLISKGYGETRLVNRCENGVKCSEAEHQYNRRTEIKILDY